jgi:CubicO group peptidase (beta-lactamase class C family)
VVGKDAAARAANDDPGQDLAAYLEPWVERFMEAWEVPGLAVGVVQDGEVIYQRGFGVRSLDSGEPVTTRSLFHLASVSKPFVATAIMQLVEQGGIDLDAPVQEYLPDFQVADSRAKQMTVRHFLSHSSGMPDVQDYHWDEPESDEGALQRFVQSLGDQQLLFAPGSASRYSNMAYEVLGHLIATVSEQSFEEYVEWEILEPLGMEDSTFLLAEAAQDLRTDAHVVGLVPEVSPVYPYHRAHAPSSTLHSHVEDLCRWMLANLHGGEWEGRAFLTESSLQEMWRRQSAGTMSVGLSWFLDRQLGERLIEHSGGDVGFRTHLTLIPERKSGVVVLCNSSAAGPTVSTLRAAVVGFLLGRQLPLEVRPPVDLTVGRVLLEKGLQASLDHYRDLRKRRANAYDYGESRLEELGYRLLRRDRLPEAVAILELNAEQYPRSSQTWSTLGDALLRTENRAGARRSFEQCLQFDPSNAHALAQLQELGE